MITRCTSLVMVGTLLCSIASQAQTVEFLGCYVEQNNQCADVEITCGSNPDDNYAAFDTAIGRLCDQVLARDQQISTLNTNLSAANERVTSQSIERNAYKSLYTKLLREKTKRALRITRIKRACGKKCRGM